MKLMNKLIDKLLHFGDIWEGTFIGGFLYGVVIAAPFMFGQTYTFSYVVGAFLAGAFYAMGFVSAFDTASFKQTVVILLGDFSPIIGFWLVVAIFTEHLLLICGCILLSIALTAFLIHWIRSISENDIPENTTQNDKHPSSPERETRKPLIGRKIMVMKDLNNKQFIHLLQMMAGQDEGGLGEVFREAARRLNEFESKMANVSDLLEKSKDMEG